MRCGAPKWYPRVNCKAVGQTCHTCSGPDHFSHCCRKKGSLRPAQPPVRAAVRAMAAQEQSQEVVDTVPDYTPPYFQSAGELPMAPTHQIRTVPVCRLQQQTPAGEHIRPAWISEKPTDPISQIDCEVDTGAGCNMLPIYKASALFGQE